MAGIDQASIGGTIYELVPEIAPLFDNTKAYVIGDYVIKDAALYRFTSAHAAGAWVGTDAVEVTVGEELNYINTAIDGGYNVYDTLQLDGNNTAVTSNGDGTYTVGTSDWGRTWFGGAVLVKAGAYLLYGVPQGYAYLSANKEYVNAMFTNDTAEPKKIVLESDATLYLGFFMSPKPSESFVIRPFLMSTIMDKNAKDIADLNSATHTNLHKFSSARVSLSGNYFDYKNAEWLDGFDAGGSINTSLEGYYHAFAELVGAGNYIRVMNYERFGSNANKVALYDKNKQFLKTIAAERIGNSYGGAFTLSEEDARTAAYTTVNYKTGNEYDSALFYNSDAYPLKAGLQAALPNYKPISDALYKSTFICDGDSICQAIADQPKYANGWWGRIVLDYSAVGKNYGIGGGTITSGLYYSNGNPRHWVNESLDTIHSEYPELDYLILEGGTNDADLIGRFSGETAPAKFGSWSKTDFTGNYDNTTFCGAVDTMFYKAVTYWPKAKIGFIVAMQMGTNNESSANRRRYFDEIKAIAKKWHIPVLDLWDESQMDARLTVYYDPSMTSAENVAAKKCYYDGQHPTSYGYDLMQGKVDNWIHSL